MSKTYVAFDIEKAGCMNYAHPMVSIGYAVGDSEGKLLDKNKINLKVTWPKVNENGVVTNYGDFEPRCWDEFWSKRPTSLITNLQENAVSQAEGMQVFANFLDGLEKKYEKIVFLSDNAGFDIAALDINLERYVRRIPLRYSTTNN